MNPILHIVMGPNGAGKSTFGSLYTDGIPVYDPDKRGMEIRTYIKNLSKSQRKQLYPAYTNDMFEELFDELTADYQWEEYDELRKHCIADSIDFAFNCIHSALQTLAARGIYEGLCELLRSSGWLIRLQENGAEGQAIVGNLNKALRMISDLEAEGLGLERSVDQFIHDCETLKLSPGTLSTSSTIFYKL